MADLIDIGELPRGSYLGSGDIAAIMGVSKWRTPLDVYLAKRDSEHAKVDLIDKDKARILRRGHRLEPYIVEMMVDRLRDDGHQVELVARNRRFAHPDHPYLAAEIDCELVVDGEPCNGEAKSGNWRTMAEWGESETDEIPIHYAAQVHYAQALTGRRMTWVAGIFSLDDIVMFKIAADDELQALMIETAVRFWRDNVLAGVPPDPNNMIDLAKLYVRSGPPPVEANEVVMHAVNRMREIRDKIKHEAAAIEECEFEIGAFMGESDTLMHEGRKVLTWRHQVRSTIDAKRLQREQTDIAAQYTRQSVSRPMIISRSNKA